MQRARDDCLRLKSTKSSESPCERGPHVGTRNDGKGRGLRAGTRTPGPGSCMQREEAELAELSRERACREWRG